MTDSANRRDFLKRSGGLLAAAALGTAGLAADAPPKKRALRKAIMYATIGLKAPVLEQFRAVKAAGFEGVEPMSHMKQDEVMKALEETGLKAASVCCNTHWSKPLSSPKESDRRGRQQTAADPEEIPPVQCLCHGGVLPGVDWDGTTTGRHSMAGGRRGMLRFRRLTRRAPS